MAAGSAAERAETGGIQKARFRGREVVLTFSMQARSFAAPLDWAVTAVIQKQKFDSHDIQ